jgi:hemolysin III
MGDHGAVNVENAPAPQQAATRGRLSRGVEVPVARGLLHLSALVAALPAGVVLVWQHGAGDGVAVYAVGLVGLYAVSASYHLCPWTPTNRRRMGKADHGMIFVFIGATATPYCLIGVPGDLSDVVLGLVWLGACAAVWTIATRFEASRVLISAAYIVLGWLAVITLPDALRQLDAWQIAMLASMGLCYTAGAGVLATKRPNPSSRVFGYHEVWHTMVVLASACGFLLVWSLGSAHH